MKWMLYFKPAYHFIICRICIGKIFNDIGMAKQQLLSAEKRR